MFVSYSRSYEGKQPSPDVCVFDNFSQPSYVALIIYQSENDHMLEKGCLMLVICTGCLEHHKGFATSPTQWFSNSGSGSKSGLQNQYFQKVFNGVKSVKTLPKDCLRIESMQ